MEGLGGSLHLLWECLRFDGRCNGSAVSEYAAQTTRCSPAAAETENNKHSVAAVRAARHGPAHCKVLWSLLDHSRWSPNMCSMNVWWNGWTQIGTLSTSWTVGEKWEVVLETKIKYLGLRRKSWPREDNLLTLFSFLVHYLLWIYNVPVSVRVL